MTKLPAILSLAAIAVVLAGCATTPAVDSEASSTPAATTAPSSAASVTPSSEPVPEATTEVDVPTEAPPATNETPVESPIAEPSVEAPIEEHLVIATNPSSDDASRITVSQGSTFTVTGTGYQPGQNVFVNMGVYQSDSMVMEEQSAIADGTGSFSLAIAVAPDLAPNTYAILALVRDGVQPGPDVEATKQFAVVEVVPA